MLDAGSRSTLHSVDENEDVLVNVRQGVGLITLNRPKAINSLTHPMVNAISPVLTDWADNDDVHTVIVDGAGERGLCAGGDLVALYHSARADGSVARSFWYDEYRLNAQIGRFPKPYVALMDGIVMGGGVGVAVHGSVRVVTDTTKMAMPEVGIGFIPDVGGTLILSRAPGLLGLHAALTGAHVRRCRRDRHGLRRPLRAARRDRRLQGDRHRRRRRRRACCPRRRTSCESVSGATGMDRPLLCRRDRDRHRRRAARPSGTRPAVDAADLIDARSPISVSVALEAVRRAAKLDTLEDVLRQEYRTSCGALRSHDFEEGIRAQVIDKDRNPKWSPASLAAVTTADVEAYFAPADRELEFS